MKYTKIIKRETKIMIAVVVVMLVVVLGVSYALFMQVTDNTNNQVITTGTLQVEYASSNGYITNDNYNELIPMSNDKGLVQKGYNFSVKNTGNLPVTYKVYMFINEEDYNNDKANKKIAGDLFTNLNLIKFNIETNKVNNNEVNIDETSGIKKYEIYTGTVNANQSINNHTLRIWLDEDLDVENIGKYIYLKLEVASYITGQEPESSSQS